ncbi:branched-chain amino acid transport system substrate-binding protein [Acidovorax delafieldii]|uniref:Branched-chain amino acid transport system substrate-binding protein n=1 Tax=Acidovorax delafieldii TaxID=47920 RepID=A0AAJ2F272_ACIDE|nr:branched-chain amino acid ABC transporter substrate-binding protein [Acidovorax delafieldii]MDR6768435.1 branched-chain amino acid transport system substrate-binding protein [Acidovorax delafieldii]MDR6837150.1 branched-chain amino acid transport system substrate-binding protein [Acidovorax delafieldii]MDR7366641.1 branched-chain amino acid transport system substrate-binding protein [Acidovorax delafieldii]
MNKLQSVGLKSGAAALRHTVWAAAVALVGAVALAPAAQAQAPAPAAVAQAKPVKLALIESLSGPFANTGEAVYRNIYWAMERVNARGGVQLPASSGGPRPLVLERYDSKGQNEEALSALRAAIDDGAQVILQGNSSSTAAVLIEAINKHNEREPNKRVLFLNYSAVDPILTNEKCSFWHFRFDAHADMRMAALMEVMREDKALKSVYLIGQDYSFGQAVLREAKKQLAAQRPDVAVVGEELHPIGRVKDFAPYAVKIKSSGAQAVVTGNWGNDLTLLVKAARDVGYEGSFYTFYGNALGAPAAIGDAGIGKVVAVADWLPNVPGAQSEAFYQSFRTRFPKPQDDYVHMRMQLMVEALAQSIERAGSTDVVAVARQMESANVQLAGQGGTMRAADHQFQQALAVGVMDKKGAPGVKFDVEGSGYGFRVVRQIAAAKAQQPHSCQMQRY